MCFKFWFVLHQEKGTTSFIFTITQSVIIWIMQIMAGNLHVIGKGLNFPWWYPNDNFQRLNFLAVLFWR